MRTLITLSLCSLSFTLIAATNTSYKKAKSKKRSKIKVDLVLKNKFNSNTENLVINSSSNPHLSSTISSTINYKTKLNSNIFFLAKTSFDYDRYMNTGFNKEINARNKNSFNKNITVSQEFKLITRVLRRQKLTTSIKVSKSDGFSVEQEFASANKLKNNHIIDQENISYNAELGYSIPVSKRFSLQTKAGFNQQNYNSSNYTFDEKQGSNDRRSLSIGVMGRVKINKETSISSWLQQDDIQYRNRLPLATNGFFQTSGTSTPLDLRIQEINFRYNHRVFELGLKQARTDDLSNSAEDNIANTISGAFNFKIKKLFTSLKYSQTRTNYKNMFADNRTTKREDSSELLSASLSYRVKSSLRFKYEFMSSATESNSFFGNRQLNSSQINIGYIF